MVAVPVVKLTPEQWAEAGEKSKLYRRQFGLTQASLAVILNCIAEQISNIERGGRGRSSRVAADILKLNIDV